MTDPVIPTEPPTTSTTISPAQTPPAKPVIQKIGYHGDVGDIIGLHVINLLLNICTIGIYSFWGKTRIRRYMTGHLSLGKDAFQYTGTGGELFIGWLKALLIFVPLIFLIAIPVVNLIVYPFFFGMIAVAIYLAMRYRLSRTTWRGIRFSLGGSALSYLWISIKRFLVNVFTLGIKVPKSDIIKWTYIANHIQYGEAKCTYEGDHKRIFKVHMATIGISLGITLIYAIYIGTHIGDLINHPKPAAGTPPDAAEIEKMTNMIFKLILPFYAVMFGIVIARTWYYAALWQEKFRGLRLGDLRFKLDITAPAMIKMYALNMLIVIFTLGLGKPIATHMIVRFFTDRLKIAGNIDGLIVEQNKSLVGSGTGDALAADVGFDLGL